jgi:hypothetical protein
MAKKAYGRRHQVVVSLTFDRPVTAAAAEAAGRGHIKGIFEASAEEREREGWGKFIVRTVKRVVTRKAG